MKGSKGMNLSNNPIVTTAIDNAVDITEATTKKKGKAGRPVGSRSDQTLGMIGPNYSVRGAARFLGVSISTLRRLARIGEGPERVKVSPNRYVYPHEGLETFMAKRRCK